MLQSNIVRGFGVVVLVLMSSWVSARSLSDLDAMHEAALQRTLAMRVAKAHIQVASGIDYDRSVKSLNAAIKQYETNMDQLEANSPNSLINQRILKLKQEWSQFKTTALSHPTRKTVVAMLEGSNNLLFHTDSLVREWQARLPQARGERNELALQQSMLSERIGLFYAAHFYGISESWVLDELNYSVKAYEGGMAQLNATSNNSEDAKVVSMLGNQWSYAKLGLQQINSGNHVPVVISVAMESMYSQSNQLGELYRDEDRLAMNGGRVTVGLAANVSAD